MDKKLEDICAPGQLEQIAKKRVARLSSGCSAGLGRKRIFNTGGPMDRILDCVESNDKTKRKWIVWEIDDKTKVWGDGDTIAMAWMSAANKLMKTVAKIGELST